ncbi:MAG: glutamine--tRNA ligase/YqeY domain fusion protein [Phycisphaerae bacterium]
MSDSTERPRHFIHELIDADIAAGRWGTWPSGRPRVHTRFPPEPNGYLHIGHAKSICLNYGLAAEYGGKFNLRFDDTNPVKEEQEYVDSIVADVRWLGADWEDRLLFASDYFQAMYDFAVELIHKGKAYVCDLGAEAVAAGRGSLTKPGQNSPHRDRPVAENLALFERMRKGEFPDGSRTLRARIDMAHPNLNLRDPVMYRILHREHHRTGEAWCIYPMYDWAHGLEDLLEGITHSICTLEFENHRPLYDWFIDAINEGRGPGSRWGERVVHPQQIEFARLELTHTVMSKRKLLELVKRGLVRGWDDPRMPTLSGLRRRGYTPESIRRFAADIGVAKFNSTIELVRLENAIRDELNRIAPRRMAVLRPLKVVIDNYPAGKIEELEAVNNPEDASAGKRRVPFGRELYIERDDFRADPPKGFFRLSPGREVRLRWAYLVTCTGVETDASGEATTLHCTYDPATRGGDAPDGRKVKGTIHWVSAEKAIDAEVRLYDPLLSVAEPESGAEEADFTASLNPQSLEVVAAAKLEPSLATAQCGVDAHGALRPERVQFERHGYFCTDPDSRPGRPVFNRTVSLKDTWAKVQKRG